MIDDFTGSKVALFCGDKIAVLLRDDRQDIPNPGMWDFFGGGREGEETPIECAIREINEELGIFLSSERFIWNKRFPSVNEPGQFSYFLVAHLTQLEIDSAHLTEGQRWEIMEVKDFLAREDAIEKMKVRLLDYLEIARER